jgi:hypothetical protein
MKTYQAKENVYQSFSSSSFDDDESVTEISTDKNKMKRKLPKDYQVIVFSKMLPSTQYTQTEIRFKGQNKQIKKKCAQS